MKNKFKSDQIYINFWNKYELLKYTGFKKDYEFHNQSKNGFSKIAAKQLMDKKLGKNFEKIVHL